MPMLRKFQNVKMKETKPNQNTQTNTQNPTKPKQTQTPQHNNLDHYSQGLFCLCWVPKTGQYPFLITVFCRNSLRICFQEIIGKL